MVIIRRISRPALLRFLLPLLGVLLAVALTACRAQDAASTAEDGVLWDPMLTETEAEIMGVAELLMDEANVDEVDSNGLTALHRAAAMGDVQVIDNLIKRGAKKEKKEARNGWTPLHVAVNSNQLDVIEALIVKHRCDKEAKAQRGMTPLHTAMLLGHVQAAKLLLKLKAKVNARGDDGQTALHIAAMLGHLDCVKLLVESGADKDVKDKAMKFTPLYIAYSRGNMKIVDYLLSKGASKKGVFEDEL